jgi:hypothetical protein
VNAVAQKSRALLLGFAWSLVACGNGAGGTGTAHDSAGSGGQLSGAAGSVATAGGGGAAANGAAAGATAAGAAGLGGATAGGAGGSGGTAIAGSGGSAGSAGGGGSGGAAQSYGCTMVLGSLLTSEWWNQGFEMDVGDASKWELKWHHHGNLIHYGDINSPFWGSTGDPLNDAQGSPILSPCAEHPDTPDRIVFFAIDWDYLSEQEWIDGLTQVVKNIKLKYPSAQRIDLMNEVRCPQNQMCNPNAKYGPGADADGQLQDCYVQPYVDSAMQKVIAADPVLAQGPVPMSAACNPAHNGAHLTSDANVQAAKDIAAFYE